MKHEELDTLTLVRQGPRLDVRLARPAVRNAFDERMIGELLDVLEGAGEDTSLRCLVLSGEGPVFCAGADLNWMKRAAAFSDAENLADARRLARLLQLLNALPFTTVAVIRGAALGGGGGLAACADIALAADDAKFGFTEVRLGIVPAVISPFVVRRIGTSHARRYFTTGEIFNGRRAREIGLISESVPGERLDTRAEEVIAQILSVGPRAARAAKGLALRAGETAFPKVLEEMAAVIAEIRGTAEAREGISAFLDKRRPSWQEVEGP